MGVQRDTGDCGTNLVEILSNALPSDKNKEKSSDSSVSFTIFYPDEVSVYCSF